MPKNVSKRTDNIMTKHINEEQQLQNEEQQ